jgi:hypothetical protein
MLTWILSVVAAMTDADVLEPVAVLVVPADVLLLAAPQPDNIAALSATARAAADSFLMCIVIDPFLDLYVLSIAGQPVF